MVEGSKVLREYHITDGKIQSGGGRGKKIIADYILAHKIASDKIVYLKDNSHAFHEYEMKFTLLERVGDFWIELQDTVLFKYYDYSTYTEKNLFFDNKKYYFYAEISSAHGNSAGSENFFLYDINKKLIYNIEYNIYYSLAIPEIDIRLSKNLEVNSFEKNYLEKKLNKTIPKQKLSTRDSLITDYFTINDNSIKIIQDSSQINRSIKFKKISTKIDFINRIGSSKKTIQNDKFIIYSFFKGGVYGFDKSVSEYFCVWIPEWNYDWVYEMTFDINNKLILKDMHISERHIMVDIDNFIYKRIK